MSDTLFDGYEPEPQPHKDPDLSAGRRLTLRQQADIRAGRHPLTAGLLHPEADRGSTKDDGANRPYSCGTCVFRQVLGHHNHAYPKCTAFGDTYQTHSAATDVRAWWPACPSYQREGATMTTRPAPRLEHWPVFCRILQRARPGADITVNVLRDDLDAAQIPATARGGLFAQAVNTGYLEPVRLFGGDVYVPSTGDSAHRARVRLYRRTSRPVDIGERVA